MSKNILNSGIEDSQTVRMPVGKKEVFITFRVEKSDYFTRDGIDVHTDTSISFCQAALGGSTRIKGVHENFDLDVSGKLFFNVHYSLFEILYLTVFSYNILLDSTRHKFAHSNAS